ncbi:hypothetical protein, partial [Massilia glaciei]|uniref:hypothetical protein n=1 Tax=Massilia glaciei TaxID=1524097 RepID=UPI001C626111
GKARQAASASSRADHAGEAATKKLNGSKMYGCQIWCPMEVRMITSDVALSPLTHPFHFSTELLRQVVHR